MEFKAYAFVEHFAPLGQNPYDQGLLDQLKELNDLGQNPGIKAERAALGLALKELLPPVTWENPLVMIDRYCNVVAPEQFIEAEKPVLIFGGQGEPWEHPLIAIERQNTIFPRKVMYGVRAFMEKNSPQRRQVFALLYSSNENVMAMQSLDLVLHHADPNHAGDEAKKIADTYVIPRLIAAVLKHPNGDYVKTEEGFLLFDEASLQRQARFTMHRQCLGDSVGKQMDSYVAKRLVALGVSPRALKKMQEQMFIWSQVGLGGLSTEEIKTIGIIHPLDVYISRFGCNGLTSPQYAEVHSHTAVPAGNFHNIALRLDINHVVYPDLLDSAIRQGITADKLPGQIRDLYDPSQVHSEMRPSPVIEQTAQANGLKTIRNSVAGLDQGLQVQ